MNKTAWIILSAVCVVGLGLLVYFQKGETINVDNIDPNAIINSSNGKIGDHVEGKKDSKVILIEYGDYQCPGCSSAFQSTKPILAKYMDSVAIVFRNFPLTSSHPNALAAASSAEAAGIQGKYWQMHDKLYNNQSQWGNLTGEQRDDIFANYASELGVNLDQYKKDIISKEVSTKIKADQALGLKVKVDSTPTFFIDRQKVDSTVLQDLGSGGTKFMDLLDSALKSKGETPPAR